MGCHHLPWPGALREGESTWRSLYAPRWYMFFYRELTITYLLPAMLIAQPITKNKLLISSLECLHTRLHRNGILIAG